MKLVEFHSASMLCAVVLLAMSSASMADDTAAALPAASASAAVPTAIYLHGDCQPQVADEARRAGTHGVTRIKFAASQA